jgi:hypothetical protein
MATTIKKIEFQENGVNKTLDMSDFPNDVNFSGNETHRGDVTFEKHPDVPAKTDLPDTPSETKYATEKQVANALNQGQTSAVFASPDYANMEADNLIVMENSKTGLMTADRNGYIRCRAGTAIAYGNDNTRITINGIICFDIKVNGSLLSSIYTFPVSAGDVIKVEVSGDGSVAAGIECNFIPIKFSFDSSL